MAASVEERDGHAEGGRCRTDTTGEHVRRSAALQVAVDGRNDSDDGEREQDQHRCLRGSRYLLRYVETVGGALIAATPVDGTGPVLPMEPKRLERWPPPGPGRDRLHRWLRRRERPGALADGRLAVRRCPLPRQQEERS